MLLLTFQIGNEHYAVNAIEIIEILPLTTIQSIQQAPRFIAGMLNYRQNIVPVVDLVQLINKRPHKKVLSSRIIVMNYPMGNKNKTIGIIAEKVTDTINADDDRISYSKISIPNADYLGKIQNQSGKFIQLIDIKSILPQQVQNMLYQNNSTDTAQG